MITIGIDPGLNGGVAIMDGKQLVGAFQLSYSKGAGHLDGWNLDADNLLNRLDTYNLPAPDTTVWLEYTPPSYFVNKQGGKDDKSAAYRGASQAKATRHAQAVETTLINNGVKPSIVHAKEWQKMIFTGIPRTIPSDRYAKSGLKGFRAMDTKDLMKMACILEWGWDTCERLLIPKRSFHEGLTDAAGIALYGYMYLGLRIHLQNLTWSEREAAIHDPA